MSLPWFHCKKIAGGPVVFNEQKQKKEPLRLQRPQYRTRMAM